MPASKKWFTKSNVGNVLFFVAVLTILFVPGARSMLTRGLMAVGFFRPSIEKPAQVITPPDVTFKDASGNTVTLTGLKGKVVFINFWATWCPPCLAELPSINTLNQKLRTNPNVVFLMVDVDNQLSRSVPFIRNKGLNLPVFETTGQVPSALLGEAIPTTVVIDKKGQMVFQHAGVASYSGDKFEQFLIKLSGE